MFPFNTLIDLLLVNERMRGKKVGPPLLHKMTFVVVAVASLNPAVQCPAAVAPCGSVLTANTAGEPDSPSPSQNAACHDL